MLNLTNLLSIHTSNSQPVFWGNDVDINGACPVFYEGELEGFSFIRWEARPLVTRRKEKNVIFIFQYLQNSCSFILRDNYEQAVEDKLTFHDVQG